MIVVMKILRKTMLKMYIKLMKKIKADSLVLHPMV
jgi:hypothetical protein